MSSPRSWYSFLHLLLGEVPAEGLLAEEEEEEEEELLFFFFFLALLLRLRRLRYSSGWMQEDRPYCTVYIVENEPLLSSCYFVP